MSLLTVSGVQASYGAVQALSDVSLSLAPGEVLALLGRNGMGKSTTIQCISRLLPVTAGQILFNGSDLASLATHQAAQLGIGLVPEGRRCFRNLSVNENLLVAARPGHWNTAAIHHLFPVLAERQHQSAALLSGGEQQMLAIARALMTNPRLLLLDEATEGLAPLVRQQIWQAIEQLKTQSELAILLVDKSVREMARVADRAVILERGRSVWSGPMSSIDDQITRRYLSV